MKIQHMNSIHIMLACGVVLTHAMKKVLLSVFDETAYARTLELTTCTTRRRHHLSQIDMLMEHALSLLKVILILCVCRAPWRCAQAEHL